MLVLKQILLLFEGLDEQAGELAHLHGFEAGFGIGADEREQPRLPVEGADLAQPPAQRRVCAAHGGEARDRTIERMIGVVIILRLVNIRKEL